MTYLLFEQIHMWTQLNLGILHAYIIVSKC